MLPATVVDPRALRAVCGSFPTGVTVVTTGTPDAPAGVTVNSFTSVSLDPPLVLFCLHNGSGIHAALRAANGFAINILAADQEEISHCFASAHARDFELFATHPGAAGIPIFTAGLAYLQCRLHAVHDGGDHQIIVGEVFDLAVLRDTAPLVFMRRSGCGPASVKSAS